MKTIADRVKSKYSKRSPEEMLEVIAQLLLKNDKLTNRLFGSMRERYVGDPEGATLLFDEAEELSASAEEADETETPEKSSDPDKKEEAKREAKPSSRGFPSSRKNS